MKPSPNEQLCLQCDLRCPDIDRIPVRLIPGTRNSVAHAKARRRRVIRNARLFSGIRLLQRCF